MQCLACSEILLTAPSSSVLSSISHISTPGSQIGVAPSSKRALHGTDIFPPSSVRKFPYSQHVNRLNSSPLDKKRNSTNSWFLMVWRGNDGRARQIQGHKKLIDEKPDEKLTVPGKPRCILSGSTDDYSSSPKWKLLMRSKRQTRHLSFKARGRTTRWTISSSAQRGWLLIERCSSDARLNGQTIRPGLSVPVL